MLFFVVILYSFLFFMGALTKNARQTRELKSEAPAFTASELKEKEERVRAELESRPVLMAMMSLLLLAVLVTGCVLDIHFIRLTVQGKPWIIAPLPRAMLSWGFPEILTTLVLLFFTEGCLFLVQVFGLWLTGLEISQDALLLANSLLRDIAVAVFVLLMVRRRKGRPFWDLGLRSNEWLRQVWRGVVSYVAMTPVLVLCFTLIAAISGLFSYEPVPQNVVQMYLKPDTRPYLLWFTLFVAGLGPVLEEMYFRGFAYPVLRARFGVGWAAAVTALVFAAFHMNAMAMLPIFVLGVYLCYLYEATGSLVPSITAHVLHNTLMVLMTLGFRAFSS